MADQENLPPIHREMRHSSGEQAALALVTAGALVAVADRHLDPVERDAVIRYIHDRRLAPGVGETRLARLFEQRARRLEEADFANVMIDALRPIPGHLLSSEVVELAERVAAADRGVHPYELQAVKFLRLLASLPRSKSSPA
jgi:tellurite resistance protein TerB